MDRLQGMRVFLKVAECAGFAGAARALGMSPAAVTRTVAALEAAIGARLMTRTTRSVMLTDAGSRYAQDCRHILAEVEDAEANAAGSHGTPTGTLIVTASVMFGQLYVLPVLTEFLTAHPGVRGRALFEDRVINLVEEGVHVAVRIGTLPDSEYRASQVGEVRRVMCASPAYLREHGTPQSPRDLAGHTLAAVTRSSPSPEWQFGGTTRERLRVTPRLTCSTNGAAIAAALAGWSIARVLSYQVAAELAQGTLVRVLQQFEGPALPVSVVYAEGKRAPAKVREFARLATERLRANPLVNPR